MPAVLREIAHYCRFIAAASPSYACLPLPPPQGQWSCMTCRRNKLGPKIYCPHLRPRNPVATHKGRVRRSSPVGSPQHNPHGGEARRSGPAPLQVAIPLSPNLPFSLAAIKDPGGGSGGTARPGWKGLALAGHRRGSGPQASAGCGDRGATGPEGRGEQPAQTKNGAVPAALGFPARPRGTGSCEPGTPIPRGSPSVPGRSRFARRPGSPAPPGRAGRGVGGSRACAPGAAGGVGRARGGGTGAGAGARLGHVWRRRGRGRRPGL